MTLKNIHQGTSIGNEVLYIGFKFEENEFEKIKNYFIKKYTLDTYKDHNGNDCEYEDYCEMFFDWFHNEYYEKFEEDIGENLQVVFGDVDDWEGSNQYYFIGYEKHLTEIEPYDIGSWLNYRKMDLENISDTLDLDNKEMYYGFAFAGEE